MNAREITGWEARLCWLTFILFSLLNLPWRKVIKELVHYWRTNKGGLID